MPRLVRRRPLIARIKDYLHPADWLIWISEELETRDWDSTHIGTPVATLLHILTLISQANITSSAGSRDDVFSDNYQPGTGWVSYVALITVYLVSILSILNAIYTFHRKRSYRLFESSIDAEPRTSSAQRVRVDSSPISSSPLRIFSNLLGYQGTEPMGHPNPLCHVWEVTVWDPLPVCLRLFCLFSPGHVLVYWLFLPTKALDPQPSVTVLKTIFLQALITIQLLLLQTRFSQQKKDSSIINQEVMNEYDKKFVHSRLNPLVRDVGTQYISSGEGISSERLESVTTYKPAVIIKRSYQTNPNPNYARYYDPDNLSTINQKRDPFTPNFSPLVSDSSKANMFSESSSHLVSRQPQSQRSTAKLFSAPSVTKSANDGGGTLGIYSHANSPLRKATSIQDLKYEERGTPKNSFSMASREIREQKDRLSSFSGNGLYAPQDSNGLGSGSAGTNSSSNHNINGNENRWPTNTASTTTATGTGVTSNSSTYRHIPRNAHERYSNRVPSRF